MTEDNIKELLFKCLSHADKAAIEREFAGIETNHKIDKNGRLERLVFKIEAFTAIGVGGSVDRENLPQFVLYERPEGSGNFY